MTEPEQVTTRMATKSGVDVYTAGTCLMPWERSGQKNIPRGRRKISSMASREEGVWWGQWGTLVLNTIWRAGLIVEGNE